MKKNILLLLPLLMLCVSCQYFDRQVPSEEELLQKELKSINWNEVDEFPSVAECDTVADKAERQRCFFEFLTQTIQQKLSIDTLALLYPELDTIDVRVTVFPDSQIEFEPQVADSITQDTIMIDSIIKLRLADFPKINPAIKRGMPVKTQFVLPVILKAN
ncbi:MAG TPA: hypothetical protein VF676_11840 [Flavobacterium sp.]|jgi:hypothetical protein